MSPLPNTSRHKCKSCNKVIQPRKTESKRGYSKRVKCDRCYNRDLTTGPRGMTLLLDHWKELL